MQSTNFITILNNSVHRKDGIAAATGQILQSMGYAVTYVKIDSHLNRDCGLLSPLSHGEVFVLSDGTEADMAVGVAERLLGFKMSADNVITCGQVIGDILRRERKGSYQGKTVRFVSHVAVAMVEQLHRVAKTPVSFKGQLTIPAFCIIEISDIFDTDAFLILESLKILRSGNKGENKIGGDDCIESSFIGNNSSVNVATIMVNNTQPLKKREISYLGLNIDASVYRNDLEINKYCCKGTVVKVEKHTNIYELAGMLLRVKFDNVLQQILKITGEVDFNLIYKNCLNKNIYEKNNCMNSNISFIPISLSNSVVLRVFIVGKYVNRKSAYLSVVNSIIEAGIHLGSSIELHWIDSCDLENGVANLNNADAIIVPGGFGTRGTEGMIMAVNYARLHKIPFLGICYGMQLCIVEFCRNVLDLKGATTAEIDPKSEHAVIKMLKGSGSMRIGDFNVSLKGNTLAHRIYDSKKIIERHRHKFAVCNEYIDLIEKGGLEFQGLSGNVYEVCVLKDHPYFVGVQYHPEFIGSINNPHPLFLELLKVALNGLKK